MNGVRDFFGQRYEVLVKRVKLERENYIPPPRNIRRCNLTKINSGQYTPSKLPLKPIAEKADTYFPKVLKTVSPFAMSNDMPEKSFMVGYTGYVPRSRQFHGRSTKLR